VDKANNDEDGLLSSLIGSLIKDVLILRFDGF